MSKNGFNPDGKQGARGTAGKQRSPEELAKLKAQLAKPIITKKENGAKAEPAAPAKAAPAPKRFGFF
jgi:hypothetical protein